MEDRDRILEKLKDKASGEEESKKMEALLQIAYEGLERGLSQGAEKRIRERLESLMREVEKAAQAVKERME